MDLKNIIENTIYLEFVNSIDNLIFELLYSKDYGYINLASKEMISQYEKTILNFKNEAQKLSRNVCFREKEIILEEKTQEFCFQIKKYFERGVKKRAQEAYSDRIENCLLNASIYKNNTDKLDEIFSKGVSAINWISEIENKNSKERKKLIEDFTKDFSQILYSKDEDFILKANPDKTDVSRFLKLYNLIAQDYKEFLNYDLDDERGYFNQDDLNNLKSKQINLLSYKKTSIIDEINLVQGAIILLDLKTDEEKYNFIKQIEDDFNLFVSNNKKIEEQDKINILKKRINLFYEKDRQNYFKNVLT